jgi:hypothetical protein
MNPTDKLETPIKRYKHRLYGSRNFMDVNEDAKGEWVTYVDHRALLASGTARLRIELDAANAEIKRLGEKIDWMEDEWYPPSMVEELQKRIAHLEAQLVAVREEDAKVCNETHPYDAAEHIRALPLPDSRAEKIRKVLEAVSDHHKDYCVCRICEAYREYQEQK